MTLLLLGCGCAENFVPDPLDGYPVQQELRQAKMEQVGCGATTPQPSPAQRPVEFLSLQVVACVQQDWKCNTQQASGFAVAPAATA